jgi:molybdenum cofactor synthesis domain-containing protein
MYKIGILTIGDEVRIGQVVNTNAAWLASQLTQTGAFISEHRTIGDDREIMLREIDDLFKKNDLLITTGGLGPTHDDINKARFYLNILMISLSLVKTFIIPSKLFENSQLESLPI